MLPIETGPGDRPRVGTPRMFLKTAFNESNAMISPDGRWVAYESDESGSDEIYVRPLFGAAVKWRVSPAGGTSPVWSKVRRELAYRSSLGLMVANYEAIGTAFVQSQPRLFVDNTSAPKLLTDSHAWFDIAPDGKFVMIDTVPNGRAASHVTLALNFFDELRKIAPVAGR